MFLSQDERGPGVIDQEGKAIGRRRGIKGDIGAARFEDPENTDDHLEGAVNAEAHQ